jgi:hypothetical protein
MNRRHLLRNAALGLAVGAVAGAVLPGDQPVVDPNDPARFGLSPPTPRTVLGVHTRLTDEVEGWKIYQTMQMVRAMGAAWIVELFPWAYIEPRRGEFDWAHPDTVIREANRQGLTVIARLDFVPAWARPVGSTARLLPTEHWVDYAAFCVRFAQRYRLAVKHFVVWNEPNTSFEWGYQAVDPAAYVDLLKLTSAAIRNVHPQAVILPAGLAPTLDHSDLALDDVDFLQGMYKSGLAPLYDTLAIHAYGWKFPPADPARSDRLNFRRTELLRQIMLENGDAAKPAIVTESGWNDSPRWTKSVHPGQRITYTLDALHLVREQWPWAQALCLWCFRLPAPSHDYNDYFTLVDVNFRPKPIYNQIQAHASEFVRS